MNILLILFFCLTLAYLCAYAFKRLGMPEILGYLLVGFVLGITPLKGIIFHSSAFDIFSTLSNLGIVFLLFFIGLEIDLKKFLKSPSRSIHVAILGAIIPFGLGFGVVKLLGFSDVAAVVTGACLAITAEAVSVAILEELNLVETKIGSTIINAGIIDDIFEILIIAVISSFVGIQFSQSTPFSGFFDNFSGVAYIFFDIFLFLVAIYVVRFFFVPAVLKLLGRRPADSHLFMASFIIVLLMAVISNYLELGTVIGALIAGVIVKQSLLKERKKKEEHEVAVLIETITFGFLAPIFFMWIGMRVSLGSIIEYPLLSITITFIALFGKLLGSILGNYLGKGTLHEGFLIGWGMNARGAVELIVVEVAAKSNLLPVELYSSIVFMAFATTVISPIIFKYMVKHHAKRGNIT